PSKNTYPPLLAPGAWLRAVPLASTQGWWGRGMFCPPVHLLPVPTSVNGGRSHIASWKFEALLCTVTFPSLCFVESGDHCMLHPNAAPLLFQVAYRILLSPVVLLHRIQAWFLSS
uniref:Uncharacterized protein n=1 Tax=Gallus gallus TaxID=9031 RepID=A0A8V0ZFV2_CHICK